MSISLQPGLRLCGLTFDPTLRGLTRLSCSPGSCVCVLLRTEPWRTSQPSRRRPPCSRTRRSSAPERHGDRCPGLHRPYPGEDSCSTPGETQETRGEVQEKLPLSGMPEIFHQCGEAEGALVLPHRRETLLLLPPRLQQGFCLQVQAATVQASSTARLSRLLFFYTFASFMLASADMLVFVCKCKAC